MHELIICIIGLVFGLLICYSGLNKFNTIAGLSVLKVFTVAKTIMLVIGIGGIALTIEMLTGYATFHIKPLFLIGTALGGIIFGTGMSILGYCPGTLPISMGQGSIDAFLGIIGGLIGGIVFTLLQPFLSPIMGDALGKISLYTLTGSTFSSTYITIASVISLIMIIGAFILHYLDVQNGNHSYRWVVTGIGLALLNVVLFYSNWQDHPLGASTSYPYLGDTIVGLTSCTYYEKCISSGSWQIWFLLGAMIAGFSYSIFTKQFELTLVHSLWKERKGYSLGKRTIWALIGGFLLIFGARMADGCTSGHIISGCMQFAASSYVFAIFTFIGFLTTGHFFYKKER